MPSPERPSEPHRFRQGDAEDHQGHADGRRCEIAARAIGGRGRASVCATHGRRCWPIWPAAFPRRIGPCASRRAPARTRRIFSSCARASGDLCGAFNTAIVRLAREHINTSHRRRARPSRYCASARKVIDQLRRTHAKLDPRHRSICARSARIGFENADEYRPSQIHRDVRGRRIRRLHPLLSRAFAPSSRRCRPRSRSYRRKFLSNDNPAPDTQSVYETEPGQEDRSSHVLLPRNISRCRC